MAAMKKKTSSKKIKAPPDGAVRIGEIVPQILARYGFHRRLEFEELNAAWTQAIARVLPEELARLTQCGELRRGTLMMRVRHSALRQELTLREPEILEALRELLPDKTIKKIKLSLS